MKVLLTLLLLVHLIVSAQNCETRSVSILSQTLSESSGLLYLNGAFITFDDSGGEAELYEIDTANGNISRTITVQNAANIDWEAITSDDDYIYIGDIGNNYGTRTDLRIYKIGISDFETSNSVTAEIINIEYTNQTTFVSEPNATRFDAEALAHVNGEILLFSKNWQSNTSLFYNIPKAQGAYSVAPIDSLSTPGKVTGAVYVPSKNQLFLVGYAIEPFIQTWKNFNSTDLTSGTSYSCFLDVANSIQVEGVCATNEGLFYTSEYFSFSTLDLEGEIGEITYAYSLGVVENNAQYIKVKNMFDSFHFDSGKQKIKQIKVYDTIGNLHYNDKVNSKSYQLNKSQFENGCYIVQLAFSNNKVERIKIIFE